MSMMSVNHPNSPASRLFVLQFIQSDIADNIKAGVNGPVWDGNLPAICGFSSQRASGAKWDYMSFNLSSIWNKIV